MLSTVPLLNSSTHVQLIQLPYHSTMDTSLLFTAGYVQRQLLVQTIWFCPGLLVQSVSARVAGAYFNG